VTAVALFLLFCDRKLINFILDSATWHRLNETNSRVLYLLRGKQAEMFYSCFRRSVRSKKPLKTLFHHELIDTDTPTLKEMIEGNFTAVLFISPTLWRDPVRSFVFSMLLSLLIHDVYNGYMPVSYDVLVSDNKIYWATVNQFEDATQPNELDIYVLQTNPQIKSIPTFFSVSELSTI